MKTKQVRIAKLLMMFIAQTAMTPHAHAIPHALRAPVQRELVLQRSFDFSRGLDVASIQPVESARTTRSEDVSRYIPSNMTPTNNSATVATQILDHSVSNWFNSDAVRNSSLGRTAHQIEKSMESDVSFGGTEPQSTKHSLKFTVKATQTRADLEYTGLTNAQFTYFVLQDKTNVEIREAVPKLGTQVVINRAATKDEVTQMVSLRWNW